MTLAFTLPVIPGWSSIDMLRLHIPASGLLIALVLGRLAVTSRQNASLAAAERGRLAAAVDQAAEAILTTDRAGHVTYVNAAFARMTGYPVSEILGNNPSLLREHIAPGPLAEMSAALIAGESWAGLTVLRRIDGASIDVDMTVAPLRDADGAIVGSVAVARDVSHERALEVQLVQAQRMEAVGRLAGGIAHDFNNILTAISGFAELAAAELPEDHSVAPDIAQILRASDRAAALTKELLAFGRRQVMQAKLLSLNDILDGLTPMLARLIGEDVELVVDKDPEMGLTMADRAQLEQVIVNLAVNARDAMPDGGRLTLATSNVSLDATDARMHVGAAAGPYVRLTVADTGTGMTPEVLEHAFEPFYTTKERGKGTGLGLSTVIGIVSQSLGYVDVNSELGAGSTFTVNLPRFRGDSPPDDTVASAVRGKGGLETILVAEDEDAVREFVQRVLSSAGYRVVTAPNGAKALEAAAVLPRLDLLFTDVVMPGMTGVQLAEALAQLRPNLAIVYASGYAEESVLRAALDTDHMPFLAKPFTADALIAGVREALDHRPVAE
jgi:PAS domain S-box-containing protein